MRHDDLTERGVEPDEPCDAMGEESRQQAEGGHEQRTSEIIPTTSRDPSAPHAHILCLSDNRADSQNWVTAPSPPAATGSNVGLASQFAPQSHARVVAGAQYAVLAKCVYGANAVICAVESAEMPTAVPSRPMRLCVGACREGGGAATGAEAGAEPEATRAACTMAARSAAVTRRSMASGCNGDGARVLEACRARLLSEGRASVERNIYTENEAPAGHAFGAFACGGFAVRTGDLDDPIQCTCVVVETHVW